MAAVAGPLALGVALTGVAGFAAVLLRTRALAVLRELTEATAEGVSAMLDSALEDDDKERAIRAASLRLLRGAWRVGWRLAAALAAVAAPVLLADRLGLASDSASLAVLMRVDFILAVSAVAILLSWLWQRRNRSEAGKIVDSSAYSAGDRILHALAFSGPGTLRSLARADDALHARRIAAIQPAPPIFVTSLARAGTTALLNAMHDLPGVATHRYRDMPFITAPLLWSRLAGSRGSAPLRERAHGDGLTIGLDSPEAFDEVLWRMLWPDHYAGRHIRPWEASDGGDAARGLLERHFRKIILLRRGARDGVSYLSKNNANIARLPLLPQLFPGCRIVVPLRRPAAHAASLHRQHRNFTQLHRQDSFTRRYMNDIGHLEFGGLQKPIGFDPDFAGTLSPEEPDYWLAYWLSVFQAVEARAEGVILVTQDALRAAPARTMAALLDRLDLSADGQDFGTAFRPGADAQPKSLFTAGLLAEAEALYESLAARALR